MPMQQPIWMYWQVLTRARGRHVQHACVQACISRTSSANLRPDCLIAKSKGLAAYAHATTQPAGDSCRPARHHHMGAVMIMNGC
jgi:hypothetical protein